MLTQKHLKEILDYDKETGLFTWKVKKSKKIKAGKIAGTLNNRGYTVITIDEKKYSAHRLAFLYEYMRFPEEIDHINHDKLDNRICNLKEVSHKENLKNQPMRKNNTSGVSGVCWKKDCEKWVVQISANGKNKTIGCFTCINEAKQAREEAKIKYGYHPNHS